MSTGKFHLSLLYGAQHQKNNKLPFVVTITDAVASIIDIFQLQSMQRDCFATP